MSRRYKIALDGPAGAGKSTVAKLLAKRLNYLYIDTGAMYRALTLKALKQGLKPEDEEGLACLASTTDIHLEVTVDGNIRVFCDGEEVTEAIRTPEVSRAVSFVAKVPEVRARLVNMQRRMAAQGGVVMDGRDIGTNVLPEAEFKFFLTASLEERTRRRQAELQAKGFQVDYETLKQEVAERDKIDTQREISPLVAARDAIVITTDGMSADEVAAKIYAIIRGGE